jgi:gluconate 2-dehydrogenase gamma chain
MEISRRDWFAASMALWPEIAAAQEQVQQALNSGSTPALHYLDQSTAEEIESLLETIIPSDDTPGAREAGVIYFIDRALTTFHKDQQEAYRKGLQDFQAQRKALFPESASIAQLTAPQRIELLKTVERSEFFSLLRFHTLAGFLGDPSYGGNRDGVGWKLIGFKHSMINQPPFGYYDREAKEKGQ